MACNFLGRTDCEATTSFGGSGGTVGNTIPTAIGSLTQLTYLWLVGNQLTGPIPSTLANLPSLNSLSLQGNQLTGTIPSTLASLTQLTYLWLSENAQLTGTIPSPLCSNSAAIEIIIDCANVACSCCKSALFSTETCLQ